ncbi:MAG: DnaT-like ssDNA-binding domain-containing protein [Glaciecola sp.]|jgi:hypothetical protein
MELTIAERDALSLPISNAAKVLYLLGLRMHANPITGATQKIHYQTLCELVTTAQESFDKGRQINLLLAELVDAGLLSGPDNLKLSGSIQGQTLCCPLRLVNDDTHRALHAKLFPMHLDWMPDPDMYQTLAQLTGIVDTTYTKEMVGDFVAYWYGQPNKQFTQYQWTQKFVKQRKQALLKQHTGAVERVGYQTKPATAGIETDEKTKAMIAKYNNKGADHG